MNPYVAYSMPMPAFPGDEYFPHFSEMNPQPNFSPHRPPFGYYHTGPIRPGTAQPSSRTHTRHTSSGEAWKHPHQGKFSPRYNSSGYYATAAANVSRKCFWSAPCRMRSYSASQPVPGVDSDEEVFVHVDNNDEDNNYYRPERMRPQKPGYKFRGHGTDHFHYSQAPYYYEEDIHVQEEKEADTIFRKMQHQQYKHRRRHHHKKHHVEVEEDLDQSEDEEADQSDVSEIQKRHEHRHHDPSRHSSKTRSIPKRSQTARPAPPKKPHIPVPATESDALKHKIPSGFSLKNWDPSEEPIMLLGSVFDANSLGKWIYDWTAYHHGAGTPISDMAGELWILLIQLAGKLKRSEECMPTIRSKENYEMVEDFVASGERLTSKLKKLLKACETPMLRVSKSTRNPAQLGKGAGIEFVNSLFGRDSQLDATEKFMASIRLWNLRFDANCEDILSRPTE